MFNIKIYIIFLIHLFIHNVLANSFVGNGGNSGDIELMVTKNQIRESFQRVSEDEKFSTACECFTYLQNRMECEYLKPLNSEQKNYCASNFKSASKDVLSLLNNKDLIFNWTNKQILVNDNGKMVTADAVANSTELTDQSESSNKKIITLNKNTFLALPQFKRILLLTHELLHLVKFEGKYLGDSGSIGPFEGQQGQKEFLNSLSAETLMQTYLFGLNHKYREALGRVQSHRRNWLDLDLVHSVSLDSNSNTYNSEDHTGIQIGYKRFINQFGFNMTYKSLLSSKELLTSIEVEERLNILSLGVAYRFFPGQDSLTAYGQSFVNFDVNFDFVTSVYDISDPFISATSKDTTTGFSANAKYYYPIDFVWLTIGLGLSQNNYSHEVFNLEKNAINVSGSLGVSYGF